jgi:hypothetical protein
MRSKKNADFEALVGRIQATSVLRPFKRREPWL